MKDTNRRSFIVGAGGSAAAAAVTTAAFAAPAQAASTTETGVPERLVAWVDDPQTGRLTIMLGEDEVTVHDPELTRRLARAARG